LATLAAAKEQRRRPQDGCGFPTAPVHAHAGTFRRVRLAFNNADLLFVLDIYAASEEPIEGVTAEVLTRISNASDIRTRTTSVTSKRRVERRAVLESGDLVITLGAGTVTRLSDELLSEISNGRAGSAEA
jgi:UDP-N-acetylmuramate--alanine ligase